MRDFHKIAIMVCLLLSILSKGQTALFFDKYYKVGYNNGQNSHVLFLKDSTYAFMSVVIDSATGRQDVGLYKIDKFGNLLNSRVINYANVNGGYFPFYGFNSFNEMSSKSLLVVGATYLNNRLSVLLSKIDKQTLDTIKNYIYCDTISTIYGFHVGNIIKMNPNKFLIAGNKFDASSQWPVVIEIDSNLIIKNIDTCLNPANLTAFTVKHNYINKKLILGGTVTIGINFYGFIAVADTLGNLQNTYINNDGIGNGISQVFYSAFDNTYVTVGKNKTGMFGGDERDKLQICKYTTNLVPIWKKSYGFSNISTSLSDLVFNPDGSMVAVGMYCDSLYNTGKLNYNGAMLKIRSNGDSLWMRTFDNYWYSTGPPTGFIWETFYSIEKTPEGGYIMCGTPTSLPKAKAWVVKTDSLGCELSSCMISGIEELKNNVAEVIISPNPNNGIFSLEFLNEEFVIENSELKIINVLGQEIKTLRLQKRKQELNLEEFDNGVYILHITNNKSKTISRRLIISK